MATEACEGLIRRALAMLDDEGQGNCSAACHLQAALDAIQGSSVCSGDDLDRVIAASSA